MVTASNPTTPFHSASTTVHDVSFSSSLGDFHRASSILRWVRQTCTVPRMKWFPFRHFVFLLATLQVVWCRLLLSGIHRPPRSCRQVSRRFPSSSISPFKWTSLLGVASDGIGVSVASKWLLRQGSLILLSPLSSGYFTSWARCSLFRKGCVGVSYGGRASDPPFATDGLIEVSSSVICHHSFFLWFRYGQ